MAFNAAMVMEVRSAGSGSGGYKTGASGTDRSQQDAPYITFTDLEVKGGDYDRVYSVTEDANLGAALIGNTIRITGGTNFTVSTYEIIGNGNDGDNYLDIDRVCASGNSNDGAAVLGGALATITDLPPTIMVAGNTVYYKAGTYSHSTTNIAGTVGARINHIGYNASRGDNPTGTDRPLFEDGGLGYWSATGWYQTFRNMRFKSTNAAYAFLASAAQYQRHFNNKFENTTSTGGTKNGYSTTGQGAILDDCEFTVPNAAASVGCTVGLYSLIHRCYAHDCLTGFWAKGDVLFSIANTCATQGIKAAAQQTFVAYNTVYNCGEGIAMSNDLLGKCINNQVVNCTEGIGSDGATRTFLDFNNYFGNSDDLAPGDALAKGPNATANDPDFAGAGDFSEVDDANGSAMRLAVGA